ncbi:MAG: hypothetical protein IE909_03215 [Campylobacterales bacterium]|nr:hypothetical protein [Campylobacterales bacterium]
MWQTLIDIFKVTSYKRKTNRLHNGDQVIKFLQWGNFSNVNSHYENREK